MKRLRFGTFEFDPTARELRRDGAPVRLQAQPAQVLGVLLAEAGQLVSRETLREAVWGKDTHVDFEGELNFCIAQIRTALGDSADSPLYVKTVPKRGYQFIAPVTEVGGVPVARKARLFKGPVIVVAVLAVIAVVVSYALSQLKRPRAAPGIRVAVTRFDNQSGSPELDRFTDGLTDAVVAELTTAGGERFGVIGNAAILRMPRERRDLTAIAKDLQAGYVVLGQVQRDQSEGRVLVHLIRLPDQAHLRVTRVEGLDFKDPVKLQATIAQQVAHDFAAKLAGVTAK